MSAQVCLAFILVVLFVRLPEIRYLLSMDNYQTTDGQRLDSERQAPSSAERLVTELRGPCSQKEHCERRP